MHITNAMFDIDTGAPVVPGRISVASGCTLGFPVLEHQELLLRFDPTGYSSPTLGIWPVTSREKASYGFHRVTTGCPILFLPIKRADINYLWSTKGKGSFSRTGKDCGYVATSSTPTIGSGYGEVTHYLSGFKFEGAKTEKGLSVRITASIANERVFESPDVEDLNNPDLSIEILLPWETLSFLGFMVPLGSLDTPNYTVLSSPPKCQSVHELLIAKGLSWPIVSGLIEVKPFDHRPGWQAKEASFLSMGLEQLSPMSTRLSFHDNSGIVLLENGFVSSQGWTSYWLTLNLVGERQLQILNEQDSLYFAMMGDGLGAITYNTGYAMEPGDPFGKISQSIKKLVLHAELMEQGLKITAKGEFKDFKTSTIEEHRKERNSQLKPCTDFTLKAIIPWPLLKIAGLPFASKGIH